MLSAAIFLVALRVLYLDLRSLRWSAVVAAIQQWRWRFFAAVIACALSFVAVGLIEWRAMHWAKARVPTRALFRVSFVANGFAHSLGATALVAGAVRARLYARYGVGLTTTAAVTTFQAVTSALGAAALVGGVALAGPGAYGAASPAVGVLLLAAVALYLGACGFARGSLRLFDKAFELPEIKDALAQVVLGVLDNALAMGVIWVLLPARAVSYLGFVGDYVVAYLGGALSGVPGGVGPFEGLLVRLLPNVDKGGLVAALLGFRLIFYLAPLMVAGALFLFELLVERRLAPGSASANATVPDVSA